MSGRRRRKLLSHGFGKPEAYRYVLRHRRKVSGSSGDSHGAVSAGCLAMEFDKPEAYRFVLRHRPKV